MGDGGIAFVIVVVVLVLVLGDALAWTNADVQRRCALYRFAPATMAYGRSYFGGGDDNDDYDYDGTTTTRRRGRLGFGVVAMGRDVCMCLLGGGVWGGFRQQPSTTIIHCRS